MDGPAPPVVPVGVAINRTTVRASLFRTLSDGRRHAWSDLAEAALGTASEEARSMIVEGLDALYAQGLPLCIEAGYARAAPFLRLDASALARDLAGGPQRWQVDVVFETGSTNGDLLRDVRSRARFAGPRVLASELQHAGRGRLGRTWASIPGASVTASFALKIGRPLAELDGVTLACGLAIHRVVTAYGVSARLKWPNDVLIDGRKLAGILVEAHAIGDATVLIVGIGLNVTGAAVDAACEGPAIATASLRPPGSTPLDRNRLVGRLAISLAEYMTTFERHGFTAFVAQWNAEDAFRDRHVTLGHGSAASIEGIERGVDERGGLLVDVAGERRRIVAGDLSLRASTPGCETA